MVLACAVQRLQSAMELKEVDRRGFERFHFLELLYNF
jgi:hypothetical protein